MMKLWSEIKKFPVIDGWFTGPDGFRCRIVDGSNAGVALNAWVGSGAVVGSNAMVASNAVVGSNAVVASGAWVEKGAIIHLGYDDRGYCRNCYFDSNRKKIFFRAGCHIFTLAKARAHWGSKKYPNRSLGDEYLRLIDYAVNEAKVRGWGKTKKATAKKSAKRVVGKGKKK